MYCENCGKELEENASFCAYCGAPVLPSKDNLNILFMFLSIFFPIFGFIYGLFNYITNNGKPYKPYILAACISHVVVNIAITIYSIIMMNVFLDAVVNEDNPFVNFMFDAFIKIMKYLLDLLEKWLESVSGYH